MTAHHDLSEKDAMAMISYILSLDDNDTEGDKGAWHLGTENHHSQF